MTRSPTPAPVTKLVMPVTKVRTGRPLLGQVAMTAAERQRRRRAALKSGEAAGHARKNPSLPIPRSPIAQSQLRRWWLSRQSHGPRLQVRLLQMLSALPLKQYGTI